MNRYEWPSIDQDALRKKRAELLVDYLQTKQLDHALLSGFDNIRYAADYRTTFTMDSGFDWFSLLISTDGSSTVFTLDTDTDEDAPFPEMPWVSRRVATPSWQSLWTHAPVYWRLLTKELRAVGAKRVGVEFAQFEVVDALRAELPHIEFVPITWDLLELRRVKLPDEVRLIEAACDVGSMSVYAALDRAQAGLTDSDLIATAVSTAYDAGVEFVSHALITAQSDGHDGILSFYAQDRELSEGDVFFLDFGVYGRGGYCHDFCRTGFIGEPPAKVARAHTAVLTALDEGVSMAKPGVRCSSIVETINGSLVKQGYDITHYGLGHGIGLRLIELPAIYHRGDLLRGDEVLAEGMVFCLEPATETDVDGTTVKVKEEDQFVVEADGLRRLTTRRPVGAAGV